MIDFYQQMCYILAIPNNCRGMNLKGEQNEESS